MKVLSLGQRGYYRHNNAGQCPSSAEASKHAGPCGQGKGDPRRRGCRSADPVPPGHPPYQIGVPPTSPNKAAALCAQVGQRRRGAHIPIWLHHSTPPGPGQGRSRRCCARLRRTVHIRGDFSFVSLTYFGSGCKTVCPRLYSTRCSQLCLQSLNRASSLKLIHTFDPSSGPSFTAPPLARDAPSCMPGGERVLWSHCWPRGKPHQGCKIYARRP